MAYRDALEHGESNVGLGMVPCRKGCRCADCTIDTLRVQLAELEAERDRLQEALDDRDEYTLCDCCESLTTDAVDAGGHMQCRSCTRIAELEAERDRLQEAATRIQQMVDAQALDEGLWFMAETAAEAYLQQELRRLHAALEGK